MDLATFAQKMREEFREKILSTREFRDEQTVVIAKETLFPLLQFCKKEGAFDYLVDISSVDHFGEEPRFEIVYELYSYHSHLHLRVKTAVSEDDLEVDSVISLWPTADWHEREVYDMMGIKFNNHPDLRRILMWEGYPYYPLRKDFPLAGKPSEMPDVAFTKEAPLAGGPFVTVSGGSDSVSREPRSRE